MLGMTKIKHLDTLLHISTVQAWWNEKTLHTATFYGSIEVIKLLLEYNAGIRAKGLDNDIPLHAPLLRYKTEVRKLLLCFEIEIQAKDRNNQTALHYA